MFFEQIPAIGGNILKFARRAENSLKGFLTPGALFEALGFDYIGPLPADVQRVTVFSSGVQTGAAQPDAAKAMVSYLTTPAAKTVMKKHGLETV